MVGVLKSPFKIYDGITGGIVVRILYRNNLTIGGLLKNPVPRRTATMSI